MFLLLETVILTLQRPFISFSVSRLYRPEFALVALIWAQSEMILYNLPYLSSKGVAKRAWRPIEGCHVRIICTVPENECESFAVL